MKETNLIALKNFMLKLTNLAFLACHCQNQVQPLGTSWFLFDPTSRRKMSNCYFPRLT